MLFFKVFKGFHLDIDYMEQRQMFKVNLTRFPTKQIKQIEEKYSFKYIF